MKHICYGFDPIKRRYEELTGEPFPSINDDNIFDLDDLIQKEYGKGYCGHPKFYEMIKLNDITSTHIRKGEKEVELLETNEFYPIELSVSNKVRAIYDLSCLFIDNKLKVQNETRMGKLSRWFESPIAKIIVFVAALASILGLILIVI